MRDKNNTGYTLLGSGKVDETKTIVEPVEPAMPKPAVAEPAMPRPAVAEPSITTPAVA